MRIMVQHDARSLTTQSHRFCRPSYSSQPPQPTLSNNSDSHKRKHSFLDQSVHTTPPLAIQTPLLVKCRILAATAALICEGRRQRRVLAMDVIVKSFVGEQDEERDTKS